MSFRVGNLFLEASVEFVLFLVAFIVVFVIALFFLMAVWAYW